jgi:hypothetical protein
MNNKEKNSKLIKLSNSLEDAAFDYLSFCRMNGINIGFQGAQSILSKSHQRSMAVGMNNCVISKK